MRLRAGSWYSGALDGFAFAAKQLGIDVLYHVESDRRAYKYLRQNYPNSQIIGYDEYEGIKHLPWCEIIFGGDPCQPHSKAGDRKGVEDHRYRWPAFFKGIETHRPDWIINENVVGTISNMVLDQKITDLESIGYTCQAYNIPAVSVNANHERQRIFLVANSNAWRWDSSLCYDFKNFKEPSPQANTLDSQGNPFLQFEEIVCEPAVFPVANGISDHVFRLGATGNSVVPQIVMVILSCIKQLYRIKL